MNPASARSRQLRRVGVGLMLILAGCAGASHQDDELTAKIKRFYAAEAVEEAGACPSPEIGAITKRRVLEASATRTVLQVRYTYYDPSVGGGTDWSRILFTERPCTGTAERAFTFERNLAGQAVVAMDGPRRSAGG